ncbi:WYL domain-containing protein [Amphritea pacifica]|uniref:WYL domain-containing protein n=1 Tax=Amphritea pacifica TaxID=2811233 RepID=A0ABS2WCW4_9GAMM|nr:WYL domain-containing protein [Amphritea pacifica]MBN0989528.1 WYL domain-containing protein [Amphritea pacifica]
MDRAGISYQAAEHYRIIEIFAQWEGRINTTYLQNILQISRQKASEIVGRYQQQAPDNLIYDASAKGYRPTADFQPHFAQGHIDEYGQLLARSGCTDYLSIFETGFCQLEAPLRNISASLVQPIIRAIRDRLRLDIGYTSLSSPEYESRIISPHCLVFDGIRWHVRAYCEKNGDYRDFVLSRFNGEFEFEGAAMFGSEQDHRWQTWLELVIQPDPRLTPEKRRLIELDYQMNNGQRSIPVRAALAMYLVQRLRLDHYQNSPEAQQIIVEPESWKQIQPYLP